MMLRKTFTCSELCRRWNINKRDLTDIVNDGKLRALNKTYLLERHTANTYTYNFGDGRLAMVTSGPLPITDEYGFYFNISDVETFEKEHGKPHGLPKKSHIGNLRKEIALKWAKEVHLDHPELASEQVREIVNTKLAKGPIIVNDNPVDIKPYSRSQFKRITEGLHFPPGIRGNPHTK
jgi:hypothetical protein